MLSLFFSARTLGCVDGIMTIWLPQWYDHSFGLWEIALLFLILDQRKKTIDYLLGLFSTVLFTYIIFGFDFENKVVLIIPGMIKFISFLYETNLLHTFFVLISMLIVSRSRVVPINLIWPFYIIVEILNEYVGMMFSGNIQLNSVINLPRYGVIAVLDGLMGQNILYQYKLLRIYYKASSFFFTWSRFYNFRSIFSNNNSSPNNKSAPVFYNDINSEVNYYSNRVIALVMGITLILCSITSYLFPIFSLFHFQIIGVFILLGYCESMGMLMTYSRIWKVMADDKFIYFIVFMHTLYYVMRPIKNLQFVLGFTMFIYHSFFSTYLNNRS